MILHNITVIVEESIQKDWLEWLKSSYIPSIMATDIFASNRLLKVLDSPNEGVTYCLQFVADKLQSNHQLENFNQVLLQQNPTFENKFVCFSTTMEFID